MSKTSGRLIGCRGKLKGPVVGPFAGATGHVPGLPGLPGLPELPGLPGASQDGRWPSPAESHGLGAPNPPSGAGQAPADGQALADGQAPA